MIRDAPKLGAVVFATVVASLALAACGGGDATTAVAPSAQRTAEGPEWAERPGSKFAYHEMLALAERICGEFGAQEIATTLAGDSHSQDPDIVARLFAAQVDISPIPLQRAAYGGCKRGLKSGPARPELTGKRAGAHKTEVGRTVLGRVALSRCPANGVVGGADVNVAGISCEEAAGLILPLSPMVVFEGYGETQEVVYSPTRSAEPNALGYTCWAEYELLDAATNSGSIQTVCWRNAEALFFKIG